MRIADFFELRILTDDEGKKSLTKILKVILFVVLITIPSAIIIMYFDNRTLTVVDLILFLLFITYAISYYLLFRNNFLAGSLLFISSGWVAMTFLAGRYEGINDVSIIGYILLIYLATLLTGYRFAIVITTMSVVSVWTMAVLEHTGIMIPEHDSPVLYARDFTIFLIIILTTIILIERGFHYSYQRLNKELLERAAAEKSLSLNEKKLIEQNEELLAAKLKAEESDRLKTAFLQNISHEIRTPMNNIIGLSELMRTTGITRDEKTDYINKMLTSSEQLNTLIDNLIDVSKLESGAVEINKSDFKVDELLEGTRQLFAKKAEEKGLTFHILNDLYDLEIRTDRLKLEQVINNLTDNAVKFTNTGSIKIYALIRENNLIVKIADTGAGIAKDDIPYIFDNFRQSEIGIARAFGGAGLGLSICRGYINYLGGEISVESEPGKGSVFTVTVPVILLHR